jgi:histidinol-phosphate aminotransferase
MDDAKRPEPRPSILEIKAYVGGKSSVTGVEEVVKLSSNESPLGASPKAVEAYGEAAAQLERYPDGGAETLRQALAKRHDLDADRIVCGAGSDELLQLIGHAYLGEGDEVIYTEHAFVVYGLVTKINGAIPVVIKEQDYRADVDAILAGVSDKTRIVFLANPNNPTGTYIPYSEVERLHRELPETVLLVLDEAYAEYVHEPDYTSGFDLVRGHENVVMTRTFSKIYGLASLRIGWAYCPAHVADVLNRIRGPFNTNVPAQRAAVAALADRDHEAQAIAHNDTWLEWLTQQIGGLGLEVSRSVGNFILIHFTQTPGRTADDADQFLQSKGLILRARSAPGLEHCLRLTVGLEEDNRRVVEALEEFLKD